MGTASTMNALAEAIGMSLPGSAAIPAPHRERAENAYLTGKRIVEMVWKDLRPSKIMTKSAFENMIAVNSAIGGSTNAPIHFNAIAKHLGVKLDNDDWERVGYDVPLIVNMQPAGEYLGEDFHHAGGVPAVVSQLIKAGKINKKATTVNGKSLYQNCEKEKVMDESVIWSTKKPMKSKAGFLNMKGNLFDSAIMKTSVISDSFKEKYLSDPKDPNAFEGRAIVFEGPEDYHKRIDDPKLKIDDRCMLFVRGVGPVGYPGAAEVVNMQPPAKLIRAGVQELPCIGDGRQSGTSGSPSILNASPEAATGGNLAILKTNDIVRIDLNKRSVDIKISKAEIDKRHRLLKKKGGHPIPESQTPWQEIQREIVDELSEGMVLKPAVKYQKIDRKKGVPRDNH
jgi:dihydroxy-acid dehydratase